MKGNEPFEIEDERVVVVETNRRTIKRI